MSCYSVDNCRFMCKHFTMPPPSEIMRLCVGQCQISTPSVPAFSWHNTHHWQINTTWIIEITRVRVRTLLYSTIVLLHSTWLYITLLDSMLLYHTSTSFYLTLHYSTWHYVTLPYLYFVLLDSTLLYIGSTSLHLTLHVHYSTTALLHST